MTRTRRRRALVVVAVAVLVVPSAVGQAAAIDGDSSGPLSPATSVASNVTETENTTVLEPVVETTVSSLSTDSLGGAPDQDRHARDDSTARNGSLLDRLEPSRERRLADVDPSAVVRPADAVTSVGSEGGLLGALPGGEAGRAGGEDGNAPGPVSSPDRAPSEDPASGELPGDDAAVSVGVGGLAVAAAARRGVVAGGMTLPPPALPTETARAGLDRLVRLFAPLRYSRYDDSDPLAHDTRRRLNAVVEREPGTHLSGVAERADVPLSTARHHVRILEREGLIESEMVRGTRRVFPAGADGLDRVAAVDDDEAATVLDAVARCGPCPVTTLAEELDRDPSTVTYHLKRLAADGLVERERDGRAVLNRLAPDVERTLDIEEVGATTGGVGSPADD